MIWRLVPAVQMLSLCSVELGDVTLVSRQLTSRGRRSLTRARGGTRQRISGQRISACLIFNFGAVMAPKH